MTGLAAPTCQPALNRGREWNIAALVSGVAGLGKWVDKASLIATRIRQLGVGRLLYGSDGAGGGNLAPREAWAAFRQLPLSQTI